MVCLLWSMSLQCPTFYSPIKFFFPTRCFIALETRSFIESEITAMNHRNYLIFSWLSSGIISIWCVCCGPCDYNVPPSTPYQILFATLCFIASGTLFFTASEITAMNHRDNLIFSWISFWNNLAMVCLLWSLPLQYHTFYSPIKSSFRRCVS